ncbi:MAG: archease [Solirubrobacterales bacterium]
MHRWVDHTGELELRLEAGSEEGVFREALVALAALLVERIDEDGGEATRHELHASAPDRPTLLAEWLSELAFLAETEGFVPERVDELSISSSGSAVDLDAIVGGRRADPPHLVKAVTYHRLEMAERDGTWRATVVLDV